MGVLRVRTLPIRLQKDAVMTLVMKFVLWIDLLITGIYLIDRSAREAMQVSLTNWWMVGIRDLEPETLILWGTWSLVVVGLVMYHKHPNLLFAPKQDANRVNE
jgi:hypothetical protein